jgi:hypothetical protein
MFSSSQFVAHPNIQQLLAAIWYEGLPGFRRKSPLQKVVWFCNETCFKILYEHLS